MIYPHADNKTRKIKFLREAAAVRRCHTIPIIGNYEVGSHTFNMLSMLRIIFPEASRSLIWAILEHDVPERLTGDIPSPVKWFGLINRKELKVLESEILECVLGKDHEKDLSPEELKILVTLDIFELALFCRDQLMLGNRNLESMLSRIHNFVKRNAGNFHPLVLDIYWSSFHQRWEYLPDLGDQHEPE